ncbi:hypothetical protein Goklo_006191, partial [Gossypium klotzschianum]|nr:hypothetical protein [Gossypium klotzschianum]
SFIVNCHLLPLNFSRKIIDKARTLKGVRFSSRGSSTGSNTLGSAATDSQSTREETPTQTAEEVPATSSEATKGTKRKRGPTSMKDIWNLQPGRKRPNWLNFSEKFVLQGKVEDSDIFSHVAKLRKEFKSTSKTRYYKGMVQEGRPIEELYENNPPGVHDDKWK